MNKPEQEGFWDGLGLALVILAILLGIGGCFKLADNTHPPPIKQSPQ